ncbi:MAG: ATP-binding protein [Bryobacteraceae bacterium]|nr:PAS domain S-box protein [Solibacteraceae bacterium]MCL4843050.1 PAS domain S-box protein [Bryobacteraceae bacterium]MCO5350394.1 ATP-binding protein [Bryobacteraceae bacterium]
MKELKEQIVNALLVILTVAAVICAGINYQQQRKYALPDDGATWMEVPAEKPGEAPQVTVVHLTPGGPAEVAGIRKGDVLYRIGTAVNPNGMAVEQGIDVAKILARIGVWGKAEYSLRRGGVDLKALVIISDANQDRALVLQYLIGIAWLGIGLFLFFRRQRAPKSLHFFLLCLASFVLHTFHYTGKLNGFDTAIYLGNIVAGLLAPALFIHFCLTFPEPRKQRTAWQTLGVYLPALSLIALQLAVAMGVIRTALPLIEMRWLLDRAWLVLYAGSYLAGGAILHLSFRRADDPIIRQQLKWLRNGVFAGVLPFVALYAAPFVLGLVPTPAMRLSVLFLALVPLAWAYSILRYRLMDVDIIFQQGYVYLLATIAVLGIVSLLVLSLARRDELSPTAVVLLVLVAGFVFEPLRNWIQQQLDRYVFYKDRYDYRVTLVGFARELSSEMDLDRSLRGVGERLVNTLQVSHVAFFLADEEGSGFHLHSTLDREGHPRTLNFSALDLSFLSTPGQRPYLFFESTRRAIDVVSREMPASVRTTIAELDLTYYLPCVFRGRTLAWMGVSRTAKGDFLSSDDVELLQTLSGYVAMAIENARLYSSLAAKAEQVERLKEFSENIVESINVGILAADLEDRVESWNSRIERLTGVPRHAAVGRKLSDLFPAEMALHFDRLRADNKVHQLYKIPLRHGVANGNGDGDVGRETLVNLAIAPLVTKDGQRIGRLVIIDDVTERDELERRLVQADKLSSIGLLAAGVAHEVNTPLAVISTYAQMLAKQVHGDEQKSKLLDKIAKQTFRASEIVNSLLNFSRTSSTDFTDLELNRVLRETLSLLEHQFEKAGVRVEADLAEPLPAIRGNAGKLQQVFLNLFLNARDAMSDVSGGTLRVTTVVNGPSVQVEIRDTGPGIARDHLDRIFDPFFTTKTARKGTGLGLSVTYGIVEEHGGSIEADSRPGEGAVFRLEFPAVRKIVHA